jgi:hypothetical protein
MLGFVMSGAFRFLNHRTYKLFTSASANIASRAFGKPRGGKGEKTKEGGALKTSAP